MQISKEQQQRQEKQLFFLGGFVNIVNNIDLIYYFDYKEPQCRSG